jgi:hypothetical protein
MLAGTATNSTRFRFGDAQSSLADSGVAFLKNFLVLRGLERSRFPGRPFTAIWTREWWHVAFRGWVWDLSCFLLSLSLKSGFDKHAHRL